MNADLLISSIYNNYSACICTNGIAALSQAMTDFTGEGATEFVLRLQALCGNGFNAALEDLHDFSQQPCLESYSMLPRDETLATVHACNSTVLMLDGAAKLLAAIGVGGQHVAALNADVIEASLAKCLKPTSTDAKFTEVTLAECLGAITHVRDTYFKLDAAGLPESIVTKERASLERCLGHDGSDGVAETAQFFDKLKNTAVLLHNMLASPGGKLLAAYKKVTSGCLVASQSFWATTKAPDTDLYADHADDAARLDLLRKTVALPRMSDIDTRLAQRLSATWDTPEASANFESDLGYDVLRRDTMKLFLHFLESVNNAAGCNVDETTPLDPLNSESAMLQLVSLVERLNVWKKASVVATRSKVHDRYKAALAQLSSLAGFPLHMGLGPLKTHTDKLALLLPSSLPTLVEQRSTEAIKTAIHKTKFVEVADAFKCCNAKRDAYKLATEQLKKAGAVVSDNDLDQLAEITKSLANSGTCFASCYMSDISQYPFNQGRQVFRNTRVQYILKYIYIFVYF